MSDRNSEKEIMKWVDETLAECEILNETQKKRCRIIAKNEVKCGFLRGDISDAWKREFPFLNTANMPNLYV